MIKVVIFWCKKMIPKLNEFNQNTIFNRAVEGVKTSTALFFCKNTSRYFLTYVTLPRFS